MKDVAIICSAIPARFELLKRSMITWQTSIRASGLDVGIYLYIEGAAINDALKHIPHDVTFKIEGGLEKSGSHICGYNHWYERVEAKSYIFTHPDLLFPKDTIAVAFDNAADDTYVAFKCFWIPPDMTDTLECFNWRQPETLENEKMLYSLDVTPQGHFYANPGVRQITLWEASTTYCVNRQTAERLYPLPDFGHQVTDDPYQAGARQRLGIKNTTIMNPILFHQFHPNSRTITGEQAVEEATAELVRRFGY